MFESPHAGIDANTADDDVVAGDVGITVEDLEEFYDEDEFEGLEELKAEKQEAQKDASATKAGSAEAPKAAPGVPAEKPTYYYEIAAVLFIAVYIINFMLGRKENDKIAEAWYREYESLFEPQFASLGAYGGQEKGVLLKDSQSCYKFYASGRRNCHGCLVTIETKKRHDLFSLFLSLFGMAETKDTVTIEVPMPDDMEHFVFAVVPKKSATKLRASVADLENFTIARKSNRVPDSYVTLTDTPEIEADLLDDRVFKVLVDYEQYFGIMHFTDQNSYAFNLSKNILRFSYTLPEPEKVGELKKLLEMSIFFIDRCAEISLPAQARKRNDARRHELDAKNQKLTHEQRQEAAQRRKDEARRKELERIEALPEDKRRKIEAKLEQQRLKKRAPRAKVCCLA